MLFFSAILALAAVSVLIVRAMALEGLKPATEFRAPRVKKARRLSASQLLDGPSLRGLY
jgi:hypothetical protein